jgi:hypothetical protein
MAAIQAEMNTAGFGAAAQKYRSTYSTVESKVVSGPDVALVGHSMLSQASSFVSTGLPGITVTSMSVGGENSRSIAARQGGQPACFLPSGGQIPATTTPVDVTLKYADGGTAWPLLQGPLTYTGYLLLNDGTKIPGTFSLFRPTGSGSSHAADDVYRFTRTSAGSLITVDRPVPFYYDVADAHREDIFVYWAGRNNYSETDQVVGDLQAMILHQKPLRSRYLVISDHNSQSETSGTSAYTNMMALNTRYRNLFGRRYVDSRRYLIDYGLADAGITPTSQDLADIAADVVPSSLRNVGDTLHLNAQGSTILASLIKRRLLELGWYS